ncbi:hypothetical protein CC80DRAFT_468778 [Byssothecium circinans]|uniref:DUF8004 domain-containing protein n=1 Tax=Byssothecium circinans TaxID=147558 RepID=A0A6A5U261_9PLEO|nr:hypothetical protein CC80DRAFT_468778 [Byssothecium circinans]
MSLERSASYVEERPRPPLISISLKSSIKNPSSVPSGQTSYTPASPVPTRFPGQSLDPCPSPSWSNKPSSHRRPQNLIVDNVSTLESLNIDPALRASRSQTSRNCTHSNMSRRSTSCSIPSRTPRHAAKVRRWDGQTRSVSDWDGLRRDPELWFEDGNCLVHLYARGQSRRGPSFCVPFGIITESQCGSMFNLCFAQITEIPGASIQSPTRIFNTLTTPITGAHKVELFIPAPDDASREDAFKWHITTRNFFAYVFGKSLVGEQLGQALVDLQERMHLFRSGRGNNHQDLFTYTDSQGYSEFVNCADYALGTLYYAEHYKLRDVWIDAFAHCVGMNETLTTSPEYAPLSSLTKALITRAYLEMDIKLGRVTATVRNFLEEDVSPTHLGLSDGALTHLGWFRSFLHDFYVEKFGYWPPPKGACFPQAMFKSLYRDFKNLYDYLVDRESTPDISSQKPALGGICVLQNIQSFDTRHKFPSQPHPLPLLPSEIPLRSRTDSQKSLITLTLSSKPAKTDRYLTARAALTAATNTTDVIVLNSPIVQAYKRFERQWAQHLREEKVSMTEARKVRWILIYCTLQYLSSVLRAPKEVRDTTSPDYPLCCLVTEQSKWQAGTTTLPSPVTQSNDDVPQAPSDYLSISAQSPQNIMTIQPDCQNQEYFTHTNTDSNSRPVSVEIPAPLRISQSVRNASIGSLRRLSRSISRQDSVQLKSTAHCEILVHGYGNGLNETVAPSPSQIPTRRQSTSSPPIPSSSELTSTDAVKPLDTTKGLQNGLDCKINTETCKTPTFASNQMDELVTAVSSKAFQIPSSANSTSSVNSPTWSDAESLASSRSSAYSQVELRVPPLDIRRYGMFEPVGPLGGLVSIDAPINSPKPSARTSRSRLPITHGEVNFGFESLSQALVPQHQESPPAAVASAVASTPLSAKASTSRPKASMSFDHLPLSPRNKMHSRNASDDPCHSLSAASLRSISIESLRVAAAVETMSPLRSDTPTRELSKDTMMDIFSALELKPNNPNKRVSEEKEKKEEEEPITRTTTIKSESSRSILDAIPPPIMRNVPTLNKDFDFKTMRYSSGRGPLAKAVAILGIDEMDREKVVKKSRQRSFWRR